MLSEFGIENQPSSNPPSCPLYVRLRGESSSTPPFLRILFLACISWKPIFDDIILLLSTFFLNVALSLFVFKRQTWLNPKCFVSRGMRELNARLEKLHLLSWHKLRLLAIAGNQLLPEQNLDCAQSNMVKCKQVELNIFPAEELMDYSRSRVFNDSILKESS